MRVALVRPSLLNNENLPTPRYSINAMSSLVSWLEKKNTIDLCVTSESFFVINKVGPVTNTIFREYQEKIYEITQKRSFDCFINSELLFFRNAPSIELKGINLKIRLDLDLWQEDYPPRFVYNNSSFSTAYFSSDRISRNSTIRNNVKNILDAGKVFPLHCNITTSNGKIEEELISNSLKTDKFLPFGLNFGSLPITLGGGNLMVQCGSKMIKTKFFTEEEPPYYFNGFPSPILSGNNGKRYLVRVCADHSLWSWEDLKIFGEDTSPFPPPIIIPNGSISPKEVFKYIVKDKANIKFEEENVLFPTKIQLKEFTPTNGSPLFKWALTMYKRAPYVIFADYRGMGNMWQESVGGVYKYTGQNPNDTEWSVFSRINPRRYNQENPEMGDSVRRYGGLEYSTYDIPEQTLE